MGVFDLETKASLFLGPFDVEGYDGGRSFVEWSPDEKYLTINNFGKEFIWVAAIDGSYTYFIEGGENPSWNPVAEWLSYIAL